MSLHSDITGLLDLQTWQEAVILLEPEHFDRAIQLSQLATNETHQWRTYINGLAFCGFIEWLEERATGLMIQQNECSLFQPQFVGVLNAVCHLVVNGFTLCLITTESVSREWVIVPRAVVDLPEFVAHLYVLLEVQEEHAQIVLRGCLRYDQLMQYQQKTSLPAQPDWTYLLPIDCFDRDSSHLLFYLRFLDPATLALPAIVPRSITVHERDEVLQLLPQIEVNSELWEVLTWEQGTILFTNLARLNSQHFQPIRQESSLLQPATAELTSFNQPIINVWNWWQNQFDATVRSLSWSMPQPLTPAFAMRRSLEKVETVLQDFIQHQEIEIPPQAQYAQTTLAGTPFQFCAVTWLISTDRFVQAWAVLFILVAQPGKVLPVGTKLQVSTTTVLTEVTLETSDLYLYILLEGNQGEAFTPTILSPNAASVTLPTFICHPNSAQ